MFYKIVLIFVIVTTLVSDYCVVIANNTVAWNKTAPSKPMVKSEDSHAEMEWHTIIPTSDHENTIQTDDLKKPETNMDNCNTQEENLEDLQQNNDSNTINVTYALPQKSNNDGIIISKRQPSNIKWVEQAEGCGGILVGEEGKITYVNQQVDVQLRCIWTIRANTYNKVQLKLLDDNLNDNWLTFAEYSYSYWENNVTGAALASVEPKVNTAKIETGDRGTYTLNGPVVFVQLFCMSPNSSIPCSFQLSIRGAGDKELRKKWKYTHYHITKPEGVISYPSHGGQYEPNELVTFVWNPVISHFVANLTYSDIEDQYTCNYDSLAIFYNETEIWNLPFGMPSKNYRYCGTYMQYDKPIGTGGAYIFDCLLAIFKSDRTINKTGFRIDFTNSTHHNNE